MAITKTYPDHRLPSDLSTDDLLTELKQRLSLRVEPRQDLERSYLDSFDWRLHAGGGLLLAKRTHGDYSLIWQDKDNDKPLASVHADRLPRWPTDIPAGHLRERLSALLEMRVLLPLVVVKSNMQLWRVLNEDEKTVARLVLERPVCFDPGGHNKGELAVRLTLVPVRGYDSEADTVQQLLAQKLGLAPAAESLAVEALRLLGRAPGDYSSKLDIALQPAMRADEAMRRILLRLLDTLEANVEGAKADLDSEFLHDLRVATRRTRSALSQVKGALPDLVVDDFKQRFGWLGQVTGPTRDLDVFILDFSRYRASLPQELQPDLDPLLPFLQGQQKLAQQALKRKLMSPHFRRLLKDWRQYLEGPLVRDYLPGDNESLPIKSLADARIWRMYRRVVKEGRAITDTSPASDLHELRKRCKKLRYMLEFFQALYPGKRIRSLIKQLKQLLDNLGQFQDLHVQAEALRGFGVAMQQGKQEQPRVLLAIGALVGDLLARQQGARSEFAGRFSDFDTAQQDDLYRQLFRTAEHKA